MIRFKQCLAAATIALLPAPAFATSFITDYINDPAGQWAGIDYWGVQVSQFSTLNQTLTFTVPTDSKIDIYMQGASKFLFSNLLLDNQSIATNFSVVPGSPLFKATGYAMAGNVTLQFLGDYSCADCWGDWFGGYVQVAKATIPTPAPTVAPTAASPVPEPATWATLTFGFALIGATMRRRPVRPLAAA